MNRYLIAALAACILLMWGGWQKIKGQSAALQAAGEQIQSMERAAESRRNTQKLLAQLDTEHTKALTDAQAANNQLRTDVRNGALRLSVKATCPAVRDATTSTGLGDAEARAELDPAAGERIVAITDDGDQGLIALRAAQAYIANVCLKGN
ncbi:lysis system i-spanin subunit Rz [Pseudomonas sp. Lb2C1-1]|uniref:lysis system i-spanin subunit Rz n=1 Tax=Pseudomonas TaxID=286 RepID=UPI00391B28B3